MIEMGLIVGIGLIVMFARLSWPRRMWMLSNPLFVDCLVFALLTTIHWGTFSGVMVATIGALFCSMTLSLGRWVFGYVEDKHYHSGLINMEHKL